MSAIKSPKCEIVINSSAIGIIKPSDETILGYALINKKEDKNNSLQMMAKKIITSLSKNKIPSSVSQNISIQPSEIETGITPKETLRNNCLQESILYPNKEINDSVIRPNFFVSPNSQDTNFIDLNNVNLFFSNIKDTSDKIQFSKGNEPVFLQNEVVEINDIQTTYDDTPTGEKVTAQHEFDDELPLVNFNGGIVIPLRDNTLPAKPLLRLSNTGVIPENTPLSFGMIDGQHLDSTKLSYMETRNYHTVNIALNSHQETVFNHVQSELHHLTNNPRETVNIDSGHNKENILLDGDTSYFSDKKAFNEQLPLSQILADFGQDVTKNEKKASVLQEMVDIEDVNIIQNRSPQIDVVGKVYREAQTTPLRGGITYPQSMNQTVEHNAVFNSTLTNEYEPRTLTYTFHQWKNAPSVTFELATKTELIAVTQNREVQETLKENKHLLNSEHDVYFRQEQHQERGQHHQQQEHNQQEED